MDRDVAFELGQLLAEHAHGAVKSAKGNCPGGKKRSKGKGRGKGYGKGKGPMGRMKYASGAPAIDVKVERIRNRLHSPSTVKAGTGVLDILSKSALLKVAAPPMGYDPTGGGSVGGGGMWSRVRDYATRQAGRARPHIGAAAQRAQGLAPQVRSIIEDALRGITGGGTAGAVGAAGAAAPAAAAAAPAVAAAAPAAATAARSAAKLPFWKRPVTMGRVGKYGGLAALGLLAGPALWRGLKGAYHGVMGTTPAGKKKSGTPVFGPEEMKQFARRGIDPKQLYASMRSAAVLQQAAAMRQAQHRNWMNTMRAMTLSPT